jgi:heme exporter protein A
VQDYLIEVHQLCKRYGKTEALRDVSLAVEKRTFLTLFGPNGAGKTTLIQILATLSRPTSGYITISGFNPETDGNDVRKKIGVVSHHSFLYQSLTAYENLKFYGQMFGGVHVKETIESLLHEVGLFSRMHDAVRTFSRGMQQRLSIARALLHNPPILLLDEPYSGLDYAAINMLQHIFEISRQEGRTILLTTHNIDRGLEQSDKVGVLVEGRLVYTGTANSIDRSRLIKIQSLDSQETEDGHHL